MTYLQTAICLMCTPIIVAIRNGASSEQVTALIENKIAEHNGMSPINPSELRLYMKEHIRNVLAL